MQRKTLYLSLCIVFAILAVSILVVLVICANAMLTSGATNTRIWGTVALGIGFLISCGALGAVWTIYSHEKNPNVLKSEVERELELDLDKQEGDEQEDNKKDVHQID